MKTELSSLLDGELASEHEMAVLAAVCADVDLWATWHEYQLIGDVLRSESHLALDLSGRIMAGLQHEPAWLLPAQRTSTKQRAMRIFQGGMRVAAALAGVGAVAWLALSTPQTSMPPQGAPLALAQPATEQRVAAVDSTRTPTAVAESESNEPSQAGRLQSYLVAHQAYSSANRFDGGAGYVRTVAASR